MKPISSFGMQVLSWATGYWSLLLVQRPRFEPCILLIKKPGVWSAPSRKTGCCEIVVLFTFSYWIMWNSYVLFFGEASALRRNLQQWQCLQAVDESLRSVNLLHGGAPDKQVKKYSGGMRRRLSVAISLIGDAKVLLYTESHISIKIHVGTSDTS